MERALTGSGSSRKIPAYTEEVRLWRSARMTAKGQVTIPKPLRGRLGLPPGDEVTFAEIPGGLRVQKVARPSPFKKYRGHLRHLKGQNPDQTVESMRGR